MYSRSAALIMLWATVFSASDSFIPSKASPSKALRSPPPIEVESDANYRDIIAAQRGGKKTSIADGIVTAAREIAGAITPVPGGVGPRSTDPVARADVDP